MEIKSSNVSFILDGRLVEIDFNNCYFKPTTTVLNYLRSLPSHKGTKEGCAEGDCGACTVVLGILKNDKISYEAWDSCLIFLPMLHGKQLITVENIGTSYAPHPVQQAMIDNDGSQCGYCTPGFVASLFSLYKNHNNPSRELIDDALTGNLCRCTGYRSIVEAAAVSCVNNGKDKFSAEESKIIEMLKKIEKFNVEINTDKQIYFRPALLHKALELRKQHPDAIIINGATDIALRVTKKKELLKKILDISGADELKQVSEKNGKINIGSGASLETVKGLCKERFPAIYDMLAVFGSLQIRNAATIGGNVANASPVGDMPPVLMAYHATVVLRNVDGEREIKLPEFITGYRQTELKPDEIIIAVRIPVPSDGDIIKSYKISKRKDLDISTVSGGFRLDISAENTVSNIMLIYGGMAAMTKRAVLTEKFLKGKPWIRKTIEAAMPLIDADFTPISDARAASEGRKVMARNLLLKFWTDTLIKA